MQKLTAATVFAELQGKEIALIGLGVSHRPVAKLLAQKGMKVTIYDKKSPEELGEAAKELTAMGVAFVTGADYLQKLRGDVIFRTPGLRPDLPPMAAAVAGGSVLTSEMEAFFDVCPCPMIAVTGSDGKTTTTTIIAELLRRSGKTGEDDVLEAGGIRIDKAAHMASIDGKPMELSYKEFELLTYFLENQGIALSREKILNNVWNYDYYGDARTIDTHVKKLRSKMGDKGDLIKTIWGMGYKFEADES